MGLAFGEQFTFSHAVTFAFVWAGLLVFTRDLIKTQAGAKGRL
jgi:EamA domain-containing membrane protein RarD